METTLSHLLDFRPDRSGEKRAYLAGTRIRVQDIVSDHELHGLSVDEIVREYPQLTHAIVHTALAYYFEHREEIRVQIREDAAFVQKMMDTQSSNPTSAEDLNTDAGGDQVSS